MKRFLMAPLVVAAALASLAQPGYAQPATRAEVKMERDAFLSMMRWDESTGTWVLKENMDPPKGVRSRAEVAASREQFMSKNVYDEKTGTWMPAKSGARDVSKLSRDQVKTETQWFLSTHSYDEARNEWVPKNAPKNMSK
jgi:hypothetical protein